MADCPKCKHLIYCDIYKIMFYKAYTNEECYEFEIIDTDKRCSDNIKQIDVN